MPQVQTVELPKRLPLVVEPANRDNVTTKDAKLVNAFMETHEGKDGRETWIYKRPGLSLDSRPPAGNAAGLGGYNWRGNIYTVFGNKLYKDGSVLVGTVDTTNGVYRFSQCLGTTQKLILGNGVKAYYWDNTTLTQIADVDFPAAFVKGWAYLDATTYVMTSLAAIQGSGLNDPSSWDPLNTITAQIEPDGGIALNKQLVYVVALKQWTTEFFYDAANATGSPLGTVPGAKCNFGCASTETVRDIDGMLFWVSTNRNGGAQVVQLDNLKVDVVSTKPVERLLDDIDWTGTIYSWTHKDEGHTFYIVTSVTANLTLAYDVRERMWSQWTDTSGNYLPIVDSWATTTLEHQVQHATNGKIYNFDMENTNDESVLFPVDIYTPNFDVGEQSRGKYLPVMVFVADQTPGSILQVRTNDNDYDSKSWSNFRSVDLNQVNPRLLDCGTFKKRAHNMRHLCNTRLRIKAVELQMDLCTL